MLSKLSVEEEVDEEGVREGCQAVAIPLWMTIMTYSQDNEPIGTPGTTY